MLTLDLVTDRAGERWAQRMITEHHYLHKPVDARSRPLIYLAHHQASWGAAAAAGPRCIAILVFGRPEASRCYDGGLTYGSQEDVAAGRARWDRWEILNLARVWLDPRIQAGGEWHTPNAATWAIGQALRRECDQSIDVVGTKIRVVRNDSVAEQQRLKAAIAAQEPAQTLSRAAVQSYVDFAAVIAAGLEEMTPAEQRRVIELLDVRITMRQDGQKTLADVRAGLRREVVTLSVDASTSSSCSQSNLPDRLDFTTTLQIPMKIP